MVTVVFWVAWAYLWLPLLTLAIWGLGVYRGYTEVDIPEELLDLRHVAFIYLLIVCGLAALLLSWAYLEYSRFRNVNRRQKPLPVKAIDIADYLGVSEQEVLQWQKNRIMTAHHDEQGHLAQVNVT